MKQEAQMAKEAKSLKKPSKAGKDALKKLTPEQRKWIRNAAKGKDLAYDYLTPKQIRMLMNDLPRKIKQQNPTSSGFGNRGGTLQNILSKP